MKLRQLEIFVYVADTRSFSKAAKQLYLTQPTVSAQIAALEKELQARLFVRNTKEVELSEDGEKLYQYACQMVHLQRKIEETFLPEAPRSRRHLRIAASTIPAQYILPELLARYQVLYPNVQLQMLESDSAEVIHEVESHIVDIGFVGTVPENRQCMALPVYQDELVLVMPNTEAYQKILKDETDLGWILHVPAIMREEGSGTRKEAEKWLKDLGVDTSEIRVTANMTSPEAIKKSVKNGMGITVISRMAVDEELLQGQILELPVADRIAMADKKRRNIYLIYNQSVPLSRAAERLVQLTRERYL